MAKTILLSTALTMLLGAFRPDILIGMLTALLTSLQERRREMAILRSVGARPGHIFSLLILESTLLAAAGVALGCLLVWIALVGAGPLLARRFGLFIDTAAPGGYELALGVAVIAAGVLAGLVPAWRAYRNSLADGLSIRL